MASRRILIVSLAALVAAAIVAGPAQARTLGVAEAGELAQAAVPDRSDELICVRAVERSAPPSRRRVLCLVGHPPLGVWVCRRVVEVGWGRGARAVARGRVVRLKLCTPLPA